MPVSRRRAFGPYRLDFERRLLLRGTELVPIQQKALEILLVLVEHRGEVVSKYELMQSVWPDAFVEESNLTQNIFVLRKALGEGPKENRYIATIPGRGYCFVATLDEPQETAKQPSDKASHTASSAITPEVWSVSSYFRLLGTLAVTLSFGFIFFLGAIMISGSRGVNYQPLPHVPSPASQPIPISGLRPDRNTSSGRRDTAAKAPSFGFLSISRK